MGNAGTPANRPQPLLIRCFFICGVELSFLRRALDGWCSSASLTLARLHRPDALAIRPPFVTLRDLPSDYGRRFHCFGGETRRLRLSQSVIRFRLRTSRFRAPVSLQMWCRCAEGIPRSRPGRTELDALFMLM